MNSLILRTATRFALPLMLLFSVVVLLQGHNKPGGGFIGGLVASAALALHALAFEAASTRRMIGIDLRTMIGAGLVIALASGFVPVALGRPFMTGMWTSVSIGGGDPIKVGTPLLFDLGVFILVIGVTQLMVLTFLESQEPGVSDAETEGDR